MDDDVRGNRRESEKTKREKKGKEKEETEGKIRLLGGGE